MATLITSYSETNQNSTAALYGDFGGGTSYAQAFINPSSVTLNSAKFFLKIRTGSPSGNMFADIYAAAGTPGSTGEPTGSILASSDGVNANTLTGTYALVTFTFSGVNKITLSASTNYCVAVRFPSGTADTNDVGVGYDSTGDAADQNYAETTGFVTWTAFSSLDVCFYIYADDAAAANSSFLMFMA